MAEQFNFLRRAVFNKIIDAFKYEKSQKRGLLSEEIWATEAFSQSARGLVDSCTPSRNLREIEERMQVQSVVRSLGEEDQEILWLRTWQEMSYSDIGDILFVPEPTARQRHKRALGRFREAWMDLMEGLFEREETINGENRDATPTRDPSECRDAKSSENSGATSQELSGDHGQGDA